MLLQTSDFNPNQTPGGKGKRQSKRLNCQLPVVVEMADQTFHGSCRDLSREGLGLTLPGHFPLHAAYRVKIKINLSREIAVNVNEVFRQSVPGGNMPNLSIGVEVVNPHLHFGPLYQHALKMYDTKTFDPRNTNFTRPYEDRVTPTQPLQTFKEAVPENPARLGPFTVLKKLGSGTIGTTFKVMDAQEDLYALKIIHAHYLKPHGAPDHWRTYLKSLRDLHHDRLLPIHDIGFLPDGKTLYYTTPYRVGQSLAFQIQQAAAVGETLHHSYVLRWMHQLADGLGFLHEKGMVSLNLKPANILLNDEGKIEICDLAPPTDQFDAASRRHFLAKADTLGLHPEIKAAMNGMARIPRNPHHDVHGFGDLLNRLLTGHWTEKPNPADFQVFDDQKLNQRAEQFLTECRTTETIRNGLTLVEAFKETFAPVLNVKDPQSKPEQPDNELRQANRVDIYTRALRRAWRDGRVTEKERRGLESLRRNLGVTNQEALLAEEQVITSPEIADARKERRAQRIQAGTQTTIPSFELAFDEPVDTNKPASSASETIPSEKSRGTANRFQVPAPPPAKPVYARQNPLSMVVEALDYPLRHKGMRLLGIGTVLALITAVALNMSTLIGLSLLLFLSAYTFGVGKAILATSTRGKDHMPDNLDYPDFITNAFGPFVQFTLCFLLCLGPGLGFLGYRCFKNYEVAELARLEAEKLQREKEAEKARAAEAAKVAEAQEAERIRRQEERVGYAETSWQSKNPTNHSSDIDAIRNFGRTMRNPNDASVHQSQPTNRGPRIRSYNVRPQMFPTWDSIEKQYETPIPLEEETGMQAGSTQKKQDNPIEAAAAGMCQ